MILFDTVCCYYSFFQVKCILKNLSKIMAVSLAMDRAQFAKHAYKVENVGKILSFIKNSVPMILEAKPDYFKTPISRLNHLLTNDAFMRRTATETNHELGSFLKRI